MMRTAEAQSRAAGGDFLCGYPSRSHRRAAGFAQGGNRGDTCFASDANATGDFSAAASALDPANPAVKVMVRAPQSGGMDAAGLAWGAQRAVFAWLAVADTGPQSGHRRAVGCVRLRYG